MYIILKSTFNTLSSRPSDCMRTYIQRDDRRFYRVHYLHIAHNRRHLKNLNMYSLQVIFLLYTGTLFGYMRQGSLATNQETKVDVYNTFCTDPGKMCPCVGSKLVITLDGKKTPLPCGTSVPLNSLEKMPTIKPPVGVELEKVYLGVN